MRKKRFGVSLAGGLAIGFLCFGLAIALVFFVIRPSLERGTRGLRAHRQGDVRVWIAGRSADAVAAASAAAIETEALLDAFASSLAVDRQALPLPIDLFLHRDAGELVESVVNRDSDYRSIRWAILDRLLWEDPHVRVAELVLAYGWGKCTSQILYAGMVLVAAYPDRNFHAFVAALPEQARHSVDELISLESSGDFPRTFYQIYDSPYAMRFGLTLAAAKRHYDVPRVVLSVPQQQQLYLESASLVQYLIEDRHSLEAFRDAWGIGFSSNLLAGLTACAPAELTREWHEIAIQAGRPSPEYPVQRVRLLLESGDPEAAYEIARDWSTTEMTDEQLELAVASTVLVGDLDGARTLLDRAPLDDAGKPPWIAPFIEGTVSTRDSVRLVASGPKRPDATLDRVQATIDSLRGLLGLSDADLPEPVTVVVYANVDQMEQARPTLSAYGLPSALVQVVDGDDIPIAVARALPSYVLGDTRSKLLERGVALAASCQRLDLHSRAMALRLEGRWQPLGTLSYMGHAEAEVDVQAAMLVRTILDEFGTDTLRAVWTSTSTLGGGSCLDTALKTHAGVTRAELEERFLAFGPAVP